MPKLKLSYASFFRFFFLYFPIFFFFNFSRFLTDYFVNFSMSLEYYTRNGHILPIGLAVCGICKEKHLKSVDFSNSRTIPIPDPEPIILPDSSYKRDQNQQVLKPMVKTEMISIYPSPPKKVRQMSTSVSSTNDVIVASVSNPGYNSTTGEITLFNNTYHEWK